MSTFLVTIPDEADGRLVSHVLEAVEKGASRHTLTVDPEGAVRHSRLGVWVAEYSLGGHDDADRG